MQIYYSYATKEIRSKLKKNDQIASLIPALILKLIIALIVFLDVIPKDVFLYCILYIILKFTKFWGLQHIGSNYNTALVTRR